jgi:CelD/BcsL family acetyltransferase involved in cellulose biosynthesis
MTLRWIFLPAREFRICQETWRTLNEAGGGSPLLRTEFLASLIEHFASGDELIAICSEDGTPVAITVLEESTTGKWQTFQRSQGPLGAWLQRTNISLEVLLEALVEALPGFPLMVAITQQDPELLSRPGDSGRTATLDFIRTARVIVDRSFDDYWKSRDGKLRRETSRRLRRLHTMGIEPRLEAVTGTDAVADCIRDFGRLESAGWKGREGSAVHADNIQGRFYTSLLESFCAIGKGRIYRFWLGERLAAMQLCVGNERTLVFLKTAYDENFETHGPGILMQYEIMRQLFSESRIDAVEFYGRTGQPQAKWCDNRIRMMYHVNHYRWPWLPKLLQRIRPLRQPAAVT